MKKLILLLFIILIPLVSAANMHDVNGITLLSVSESENGSYQGHTAKLFLQLKPGTGSVYIDSFPLAKLDTQLSTKLANDVACSIASADCSKYDFFYTIDVSSSIVGGPSAGAAITLLTLSVLENNPVNLSVAMTGMISSGGIITPVDGIYEKVKAASEDKNIDYVFIPEIALDMEFTNLTQNETLLTLESLEELPVTIYPVTFVNEAFQIFAKEEPKQIEEIVVPDFYVTTMNETQTKLCSKTKYLINEFPNDMNDSSFIDANDFLNRSVDAASEGDFYSAASFCYSANLRLRELQLQNLSQEVLYSNYLELLDSLDEFDEKMDSYDLVTFTDLETYMIVKERTIESRDYLDELNLTNISHFQLAYSIERFNSALAWSSFLGKEGSPLNINQETLKSACMKETRKANMMSSYLSLFISEDYLSDLNVELNHAEKFYEEENYPMCLYTASNARADAEYILTLTTVQDEIKLKQLVHAKLDSMYELISKQKNAFPIMGYSYLEYSAKLVDEEPATALLFSEYGLLSSDLTDYFPRTNQSKIDLPLVDIVMIGSIFLVGFISGILYSRTRSKKK